MYKKNMMKWKKKSKIWRLKQFIEDLSLFTKQCYHIVWSVEKIQKVKIQKLQAKKRENNLFLKKEEEASGLLSCLGIKTPLSKFL